MASKIKIAVSSCLLGEAVRYDGTDKHIEFITDVLMKEYSLISLCPEMAVGMGVPRNPIHLVDNGSDICVIGIDDQKKDMTEPLSKYGQDIVKSHSDLCGYIFKKNSPSCGTKNVKVLSSHGKYERRGQGIYAIEIMTALPSLPVIDEKDLQCEDLKNKFLEQVCKYAKINFS